MSKAAKNRKDFKVTALSYWKQNENYAVLCAPYFQYPSRKSRIYGQAVSNNVCLLSWEHFAFLVSNKIKESVSLNLSEIWNCSSAYSDKCLFSEIENCFLEEINKNIVRLSGKNTLDFDLSLKNQIRNIVMRGNTEIKFLHEEINAIKALSKDEAVAELIKFRKLNEKIIRISSYIKGLEND